MVETGISLKLRMAADSLHIIPRPMADIIALLREAADEADRFNEGMRLWKATAEAKDAAPVARQEFKATATRIVYRPKRGRKGLMYITSWMPLGDFPPNVAEVLEETTLYERVLKSAATEQAG